MDFSAYDRRIVRVTDIDGRAFTGRAAAFPSCCGMHEYDREDELIRPGIDMIFESDIQSVEVLRDMSVIRATETWQQAGAFYVRIQAMAKKHHITLRQEFDEHDGSETKYIVVTDKDFPIATARMYELDKSSVMLGRVVVLPEYRHLGIGTMVVTECEYWAEELGYSKVVLESRDNKVDFYQKMGYVITGEPVDGDTFRCVRMEKECVISVKK